MSEQSQHDARMRQNFLDHCDQEILYIHNGRVVCNSYVLLKNSRREKTLSYREVVEGFIATYALQEGSDIVFVLPNKSKIKMPVILFTEIVAAKFFLENVNGYDTTNVLEDLECNWDIFNMQIHTPPVTTPPAPPVTTPPVPPVTTPPVPPVTTPPVATPSITLIDMLQKLLNEQALINNRVEQIRKLINGE